MNKQEAIAVLRDQLEWPPGCDWESGWNEAIKYAIVILELNQTSSRDYTAVFAAWKDAI